MTVEEVAQAIVDWSMDTTPEIVGSYTYPPERKTQALPDVMIDVQEAAIRKSHRSFVDLQQFYLRVFTVNVTWMVTPQPEAEAQAFIYQLIDQHTAALVNDQTLGGRVFQVGIEEVVFRDLAQVFRFDDKTEGRAVTTQLLVAEPLEVD